MRVRRAAMFLEKSRLRKRVTLKDVGRKSGVSVMTVSNVINGKFRHVTDTTRKKVEEAVKA